MSDGYPALERAYTARRATPGAELMVTVIGRIEGRPKMEGQGTEPTLVVEQLVEVTPGASCETGLPRSGR
jgi:hypothetical protein